MTQVVTVRWRHPILGDQWTIPRPEGFGDSALFAVRIVPPTLLRRASAGWMAESAKLHEGESGDPVFAPGIPACAGMTGTSLPPSLPPMIRLPYLAVPPQSPSSFVARRVRLISSARMSPAPPKTPARRR